MPRNKTNWLFLFDNSKNEKLIFINVSFLASDISFFFKTFLL